MSSKVTWESLRARAVDIAWDYSYDMNAGAFSVAHAWKPNNPRGEVEAVMHEVAHSLALKPDRRRFLNLEQNANAIARLSARDQDANEILTCAIEVACARLLGLEMSVKKLAFYACDDMHDESLRVPEAMEAQICKVAETPVARGCAVRLRDALLAA